MPTTNSQKRILFYRLFILFFFISFLGWLWETIYVSYLAGKLVDRGFLDIPLCPIYGFVIVLMYLILGTPDDKKWFLKRLKSKWLVIPCYFCMATLIPSMLELFAGWFFDVFFHLELWTYAHQPLNIGGYVCLSISLTWGVLLTLIMKYLFPLLYKAVGKIPKKTLMITGNVLILLFAVDTAHCFIKSLLSSISF